jgi:hypothetical protein
VLLSLYCLSVTLCSGAVKVNQRASIVNGLRLSVTWASCSAVAFYRCYPGWRQPGLSYKKSQTMGASLDSVHIHTAWISRKIRTSTRSVERLASDLRLPLSRSSNLASCNFLTDELSVPTLSRFLLKFVAMPADDAIDVSFVISGHPSEAIGVPVVSVVPVVLLVRIAFPLPFLGKQEPRRTS